MFVHASPSALLLFQACCHKTDSVQSRVIVKCDIALDSGTMSLCCLQALPQRLAFKREALTSPWGLRTAHIAHLASHVLNKADTVCRMP